MEFCDECGSMMKTETIDGEEFWVCGSCDHRQPTDPGASYVVTEGQQESEIVDVSGARERGLPTASETCPECGNDEAYWYLQQIRAADESETRFFICTACENKWREDDN